MRPHRFCFCLSQVEAGADILQVFEAMGGFISEDHFYDRAMPYLTRWVSISASGSYNMMRGEGQLLHISYQQTRQVFEPIDRPTA